MGKTLLEKAKEIRVNTYKGYKEYSNEEIELAVAWVNNDITSSQLAKALGDRISGNIYVFVSGALKFAVNKNKLSKISFSKI